MDEKLSLFKNSVLFVGVIKTFKVIYYTSLSGLEKVLMGRQRIFLHADLTQLEEMSMQYITPPQRRQQTDTLRETQRTGENELFIPDTKTGEK